MFSQKQFFVPPQFLATGSKRRGCFCRFLGVVFGGRASGPPKTPKTLFWRPREEGKPLFLAFLDPDRVWAGMTILGVFWGYFRGFLEVLVGPRAEMMVPRRWYACFYVYLTPKCRFGYISNSGLCKKAQKPYFWWFPLRAILLTPWKSSDENGHILTSDTVIHSKTLYG